MRAVFRGQLYMGLDDYEHGDFVKETMLEVDMLAGNLHTTHFPYLDFSKLAEEGKPLTFEEKSNLAKQFDLQGRLIP